ncbi:DUF1656 domain-containing protein [Aquabacter sp. L1I39]|uniref:DUF1656 domain-containing protein n=1 Tax=Aquabacter sp. L1I39 TaxID=2820278 RepID=UPI001AD9B4EE|nr:DUF1656 domain-containing protein [Aquabacter sp. L1I39]QTL04383.1 DUF1656 domain-containing protein [Aquabacter sp. L1I39]
MFSEINILGVYVAPFAVMLLLAWLAMMPLSLISVRLGLLRHVWHPGLFKLCVYVIVLAAIVRAWSAWT